MLLAEGRPVIAARVGLPVDRGLIGRALNPDLNAESTRQIKPRGDVARAADA